MNIRSATVTDVPAINDLINSYAEQDMMLYRSRADIYEKLQTLMVAEKNKIIVGCCALEVVWADLAEIKSLVVQEHYQTQGIGRTLVEGILNIAQTLKIPKVFALTLEPDFFVKLHFHVVDKKTLPMKVWSDCARCPKQDHCDEIAVIKEIPM